MSNHQKLRHYEEKVCQSLNSAGIYNPNPDEEDNWSTLDDYSVFKNKIRFCKKALQYMDSNGIIMSDMCHHCGVTLTNNSNLVGLVGEIEYPVCNKCLKDYEEGLETIGYWLPHKLNKYSPNRFDNYLDAISEYQSAKETDSKENVGEEKQSSGSKRSSGGIPKSVFVIALIIGWGISVNAVYNVYYYKGEEFMTTASWLASVVITFFFLFLLQKVFGD